MNIDNITPAVPDWPYDYTSVDPQQLNISAVRFRGGSTGHHSIGLYIKNIVYYEHPNTLISIMTMAFRLQTRKVDNKVILEIVNTTRQAVVHLHHGHA